MAEYVLTILVNGVDNTAPAQQGMERLGVGGVAAGNLLAGAMAAAASAVTGFVGSSISAAGDFQQNMNVLQAASGATNAEMQALGQTALALGNDMTLPGASASDAAKAMLELTKAGLSVNDTMAAATGTLQLAAAAQTDAATAAQIVAGALNAFGLEGDKATQIADQLAAGANASAASMTDLSQGFQQAGFAFSATGQHTDDLVSALSMLTNVGLTGSDAGTALKNAMMQLMAPTDAASATMAQYGINVRDAQGNMLPFRDIIGVLQTGLAGLSPAARDAALKTMLMGDGMKAMIPLLDAGVSGFDAMKAKVNEAGAAQAMAAAKMQGFNGALAGVSNAVDTLKLVIGGAFIGVLTMLLNAVSPLISNMATLAQNIMAANDPVAAFVAAIQPALPIIMGIGAAIMAVVVPAFVAWGAAMIPILLPLIAIGAAVALLTLAWQNNWGGIQEKTAAVWAFIQPVLAQLVDWLSVAIPVALQAAAQLWTGTLWPALQVVGAFITSTVIPALAQIVSWLVTNIPAAIALNVAAFQSMVATVSAVWATVSAAVSNGIAVVTTVMQAGWNTIVFVTSAAWNAITGVVGPQIVTIVSTMQAGWATLQSITAPAWAAISAAVQAATAIVQGAIQAVISFIQGVWGGAQQAAQAQTSAAWTAIQTLITGAMLAIKVAIQVGVAVVQGIMSTAWAVVVAAANNDFGKIPAIISAGWEKIKSIMGAGVSAISAIAGQMAAAALSLGKSIVSGIISGVGSMGSALSDKLKSMAKGALDAAKSALGIKSPSTVMAAQVGMPIGQGIAAGIQQSTPKATQAMTDMAGKLVGLVSNAAGAFGQLANIGSISQSAVGRFMDSMMTVVTMLDTLNVATRGKMMASAMQITGGANKVLETIVKGVEGFAKLSTMGEVPQTAMLRFADALYQVITTLDTINVNTRGKMMASAMQITKGAELVVKLVGESAEAFGKLSVMGPVSAAKVQMFADALGATIEAMSALATRFSGAGLSFAVVFADAAGKITSMIKGGVEGLMSLANFSSPGVTAMEAFALAAAQIVGRIIAVSFRFKAEGLSAAAAFTTAASAIVGLLGNGVKGLADLTRFVAPSLAQMDAFALAVAQLVGRIIGMAFRFKTEGLNAANVFMETAGKVLGIISAGVEGFIKLATVKAVPIQAMNMFIELVRQIVAGITNTAVYFTTQGLTQAGVFADAAGKILGMIGTGVDGFAKMATIKAVPMAAMMLFTELVRQIVASIKNTAIFFDAEGLAAASVFADTAGKVLGIIGNGVTGLKALNELKPIAEGSIQKFVEMVNILMIDIGRAASAFSAEGLAAAGKFADAAGKSVGILKTGVEGFYQVDTFAGVSEAAIGRFAEGVRLTVVAMVRLSTMFTAEALTAAQTFAVVAEASTEFLKKGAVGFDRLGEMKVKPGEGLDAFAVGIQMLVNTMVRLSQIVSTEMLTEANRLAIGIDNILTVLLASIKGFGDVADIAGGGTLGIIGNGMAAGIQKMLTDIRAIILPSAATIGQNIAIGMANGITAGAPAIQNAIFAAVNAALAAARAALGIASPSQVFKEQIGVQMSAGMAEGVVSGLGGVQAAVGQVSSGALSAGAGAATTNNNQRSISIAPGAIVIQGAGQNADAIGDAVLRKLELAIGGRLA